MEVISKILKNNPVSNNAEQLEKQIREKATELQLYKCNFQMSYNDFSYLITANGQDILLQRSITKPYVIDKHIAPIVEQLYLYFTNNPECIWNLNAGLIFGGKVGCGKSVLMTSYLRISNQFSRKQTYMAHSKKMGALIINHGIEYFEKRPLFIDELGREESETKDYGKIIKPMIDLFSLRSEAGSRSYATTNFKWETLEEFYGEFIRNRMQEMMTFVFVPGETRRLKNEVKSK